MCWMPHPARPCALARSLRSLRPLSSSWLPSGTCPQHRRYWRAPAPAYEQAGGGRGGSDGSAGAARGRGRAPAAALAAAAAGAALDALRRGAGPTSCDSGAGERSGAASGGAKEGPALRRWCASCSAGSADDEPGKALDSGYSELVHAIRVDNVRRSFMLLRGHLAGIDEPVTDHNETALAVACKTGSLQVMSALLRLGADPSAIDAHGATCAALACTEGQLEVVRRLAQDARTDLSHHDVRGDAPVHRAVAFGHLDVVHYLLSAGGGERRANMLTAKAAGVEPESRLEAPLHVALRRLSRPLSNRGIKGTRYEMLELLLEFGADPTIQDLHGDTPMHLCARQNDMYGLWLLLVEAHDVRAAAQVVNKDEATFLQEADAFGQRGRAVVGLAWVLPRSIRRLVASIMFNEALMIGAM
mmetsp:Transcript_44825/g.140518  ORF Transcript_44825/g.140518 Transcript_44825/m.140518 type:complete len:416 (+) Transcript_44825:68-1315(+)